MIPNDSSSPLPASSNQQESGTRYRLRKLQSLPPPGVSDSSTSQQPNQEQKNTAPTIPTKAPEDEIC